MSQTHPGKGIHQVARNLRRAATPAEKALWYKLGKSQLEGFTFRRQFPVGQFIVDFCCRSHRLVVELDGAHHGDDSLQSIADQERTALILERGYRVLRFWNEEVMGNLDGVLQQILMMLKETPT